MKRFRVLAFVLFCLMLFTAFPLFTFAEPELDAPSVILIEAHSGAVLYEKNADEVRHPASVTKVMTLLLTFEAIDAGKIKMNDIVTVSETAAKMGGSQIFLEVGEQMSVEDLIKSVVVCSANDAAVALAEFVAGSESGFVDMMNAKAVSLGMKNTHFENTNGLDDTTDTHLTTARDISLMSSELIMKHPAVLNYTTIWQDTVRNGAFTLTNTNKLIRFYPGANGLKTGFTSKSGYCISASAKRDNLQLIAVVMGAETSDKRNVTVKRLFDYGFANYAYVEIPAPQNMTAPVKGGVAPLVNGSCSSFGKVVPKGNLGELSANPELLSDITAPVRQGDVIGKVVYKAGGEILGETDICALESVEKMTFGTMLKLLLKKYLMIG